MTAIVTSRAAHTHFPRPLMATQNDLQLSQCLKTLRTVRNVLRMAYSTGAISETLWAGESETLIDRIDAQICSVETEQRGVQP